MFEKFLYAVIIEGNIDLLIKCKDVYFSKKHLKAVKFIKKYFAEYKKYPDVEDIDEETGIYIEETDSTADYYYKKIKEAYKASVTDDLIRKLAKGETETISLLQNTVQNLTKETDKKIEWYGEDIKSREEAYQERKESIGGVTYLTTGDPEMDMFTYGIKETDFWLIAGYEKVGKSFEVLRMAHNIALKVHEYFEEDDDRGVLFITCETGAEEFYDRVDAIGAKISYARYMAGELKDKEDGKRKRFLKKIHKKRKESTYKLLIVDDVFTMDDIEKYILLLNPAVVIADSVQLLAKSIDWKDLTQMARELKNMARRLSTPIIATSHANLKDGDSVEKINIHSFSYFKGARDPDFAFVMFKDENMKTLGQTGMVCVGARRAEPFVKIWETNWSNMQTKTTILKKVRDFVDSEVDESTY